MIHLSDEKLESPTQTWGIVATLIRRLDQLNESQSHIVYNADLYDDPVTLENSKVSTTAPLIPHLEAQHDNENPIVPIVDVECHDYIMDGFAHDDDMDIEHNAFAPWLSDGDDPSIDVISLIKIEGSATLQSSIRMFLQPRFPLSQRSYHHLNWMSIRLIGKCSQIEDPPASKAPRKRLRSLVKLTNF